MIIFPAPGVGVADVVASVDGVVFGGVDEFGTRLTLEEEDGWYGSPGMRRARSARASAHGVYPSQGFSEGRTIRMSGKGIAVDFASGARSIRVLRAILADGGAGTTTWTDPDVDVVLSASVERDGPVNVRWLTDRVFEWQILLFAPDARAYGFPESFITSLPGGGGGLSWNIGSFFDFGEAPVSGRSQFTNIGTAPTEPVHQVSGPMAAGFQITHIEAGRSLRYEQPVGSDVVLDSAEGIVTVDGQDRTGFLTVREWFSVPRHQQATFQFSTLGTETVTDPASMTTTIAPAYH